jgi:hypothetical protein
MKKLTVLPLIMLLPSLIFLNAAAETIVFSSTHDNYYYTNTYFYQTFSLDYKARIVSFSAYLNSTGSQVQPRILSSSGTAICIGTNMSVTSASTYTSSFSSCVIPPGSYSVRQYVSAGTYFYVDTSNPWPQWISRYGDADQRASLTIYYNDVFQINTNTTSLLQGKAVRIEALIRVSENPSAVKITILGPNNETIVNQAPMTYVSGTLTQLWAYNFQTSGSSPVGYYTVQITSVGSSATGFSDTETKSNAFYVQNAKLATPRIIAPANNSFQNKLTVTLSWSSVANATAYRVQISRYNDFSILAVNITTSSTSLAFQAPENALWYWRVRAEDSQRNYLPSDWNQSNFYVDTIAPLVTLISPSNGTVVKSNLKTLEWSSSDNFQIASQTINWIYPNRTKKSVALSPSIASYDIVSDDGRVFWWVTATDNAGNTGISENRTLIIDTRLPQAPTLLEPANGSWVTSDVVTLSWQNSDPDCMNSLLVIQREGGGYSFNKTVACSGNYSLTFTAEGHYLWYVRANDWAGNSASSGIRSFYVVLGSVIPENLSATAKSFEFDLRETAGKPQVVYWTAKAIQQNGLEIDSVSGQVSISAKGKVHVTGSWQKTLGNAIYKLRVIATDETGSSKTAENWFLVSTSSGGRDWTQWACDKAKINKNVNFTRLYFEFGDAEGEHQVQLGIQGKPTSCQVWLLDANYSRIKELPCSALTNYITFTAARRPANQTAIYTVYAFMDPLTTENRKTKEKVVYKQILADEYNLTVTNQYSYTVYKVEVDAKDWLGFEGQDWTNSSNTIIYGPLNPGKSASLIYYVPHGAESMGGESTITVAGFISKWWWLFILVVLFMFLLFRRGERRGGRYGR